MAEGTPKLRAEELPSQIPGIPDDETQESPQSDSKFTGTNPFMSSRSATAQSTNPAKKNILGGHPSMDNMMEDLGTMLNSNTAARTNVFKSLFASAC